MRSPSPDPRPSRSARPPAVPLALLIAALVAFGSPRLALAQKPADKADSVFDDKKPAEKKAEDKPKAEDKDKPKADDKAKPEEKDKPKPKADEKVPDKKAEDKPKADEKAKPKVEPPKPEDRESLGFTQESAASQMAELEDRMFRLSEALRGLEPENASRLRLALKFSREELILEQMRETNKMIKEAQVNRAETEVRELIAKLQHLRDLLLAEDLDFQLRLARLRQIRETLGQLDRVVKEERRQLGWSRFAVDQRKARERLAARRPDLEALARDQAAVAADAKAIPAGGEASARKEAARPVLEREDRVRKAASALADDPIFAEFQPSQLRKAVTLLDDSAARLGTEDPAGAVDPAEQAGAVLREELGRLDARIAEADRDVSDAEFRRHQADQLANRRASGALGANSARLGDAGVSLQKDLIRASASMQAAEGELGRSAASPASVEQSASLDILAKSSDDLARAAERLLVIIRTELQGRLIAELTESHEAQMAIRETTQAQAPRVAQKSRTALIAISGLSQKEGGLAGGTEQLLALVEETEFGIALPTTLKVLSREMRRIEGWLKDGDASDRTVDLERRVEDDLLAMLQSVRRLPPTTPPPPGSAPSADARERERELNRLVAELKLIRLLQSRLNEDTTGLDKSRPAPDTLTTALRREIEALEAGQDEIRDSLGKIAERSPQP